MENKNNTIYMDDIVQTEEKNLVRDVNSKALLASNKNELKMHRNRARQVKAAQDSIKELNILKNLGVKYGQFRQSN